MIRQQFFIFFSYKDANNPPVELSVTQGGTAFLEYSWGENTKSSLIHIFKVNDCKISLLQYKMRALFQHVRVDYDILWLWHMTIIFIPYQKIQFLKHRTKRGAEMKRQEGPSPPAEGSNWA